MGKPISILQEGQSVVRRGGEGDYKTPCAEEGYKSCNNSFGEYVAFHCAYQGQLRINIVYILRLQKLIYLHLFTDCFMKISLMKLSVNKSR